MSQKFVKFLEKKGCEVSPNGQHFLDVTLPKGKETDLVLEAADEAGVQLRKLVTSVQTLEDVFVKLIGEDLHADL